ncbi:MULTISPECIES: DUF3263 domain-containing protein [Rhodococcus]|uniref:DUF3263 domain-containing protein n=1 Tax=Rhodococcus jostii TaxID=132919 RepID=A0ABU4CH03_RHOJO|nr:MULTISPECIES: DUF3263 domain-containing protein [Rhodococcus]MDI9974163.1 DUF3263 domain-containing protein [Rhodococcus sp. IEGM 1307]MDV6282502.1 DUF3263 domain-containing protein [Rhodococcus jostii]
MNRDADILAFATRWRHWGGGSWSDIFVEFGISPEKYFRRLARILDSVMARELPLEVRVDLWRIRRVRRSEGTSVPTGSTKTSRVGRAFDGRLWRHEKYVELIAGRLCAQRP